MKRIFFLLTLLVSVSMVSCGSDDQSKDAEVEIGKWEPTTLEVETMLPIPKLDYPHSEGCDRDYLEIRSDDTATFYHYEEESCVEVVYENAFEKNGTDVSVNIMGFEVDGEIVSEDSQTMIISADISEVLPYLEAMYPEYSSMLAALTGSRIKITFEKTI